MAPRSLNSCCFFTCWCSRHLIPPVCLLLRQQFGVLGAASEEKAHWKTNGSPLGGSGMMLYGSEPTDSALAGAERWAPSALLLLLLLLHGVVFFPRCEIIRCLCDYKPFTVLQGNWSSFCPCTRGSHAVCLWFVTVCTSVPEWAWCVV